MSFNSSLHAVIIFLITTLGGYLQFLYQSRKNSLLEEHRQFTLAIFVNLFMYGVGLMAEFKVKRITPLLGILVVVLITILLYPVLGLVAFVVWALVTLEAVIKLFEEILQWLRPIFIRAREILTSCFNGAENHSSEIQENGFPGMEANDLARENELPVLM